MPFLSNGTSVTLCARAGSVSAALPPRTVARATVLPRYRATICATVFDLTEHLTPVILPFFFTSLQVIAPIAASSPFSPLSPFAPLRAVRAVGPGSPCGPCGPVAPVSPFGPARAAGWRRRPAIGRPPVATPGRRRR